MAHSINYDILLHVIENTEDIRTALVLTSTCQHLRQEGPKLILRRPICINSNAMALSLINFLSGGEYESQRFQYLRDITLSTALLPRQAFLYAVHLESLTILGAEWLFWDAEPALYQAIAGMRSLRHLVLRGVDRKACDLLRTLVAPLSTVVLDFCPDFAEGLWDILEDTERPSYHPTRLLVNFAPSLEELEICMFDFSSRRTGSPTVRSAVEYSKLRRLHIHDEPTILSTPYIQTFPNLTHLHITSDNYDNQPSTYIELRGHRITNLATNTLLAYETDTTLWPHLREFEGYVVDLYLLGLLSHIPHLKLRDCAANHDLHMLQDVLLFVHPIQLDFEAHLLAFDAVVHNLAAALRTDQASSIVNLSILLRLSEDDREVDFGSVMGDLEVSMAALNLQHFKLTCWDFGLSPTDCSDMDDEALMASIGLPPPPPRAPRPLAPWTVAERTLEEYDLEGLATRLLESNPSLQLLELSIELPRRRGSRIATLLADGVRSVRCETRVECLDRY
ncbi:hypothetical protein C8Q80DRAFT_1354475 [Daedaleopsis nitida]|nr:hypothetical protein C8Q80DRAFT_1354475 [Daedaleopsis nitida]